ncbi:methylenetetrahydrofolate reductase [Leptospira stimsonii]|uniref:Methylenetetrahydrofolate reductase n=1 Tax=Leptospira stimsonii TaxID=2202203 RepID=A0ABY2N3E8_9LEPT|nr:methylenetetrahydrofolate reductase [Leptospira stimsonii]TGK26083.1 methylenetetrahydrofolate reductase [Leptospira stimsonii]TGM14911.1 methylenetetrahydrofolate reductase [Leptospira stimsonii]
MNKILLEVVPRDNETLLKEVNYIKNNFNQISGINIPDLLRFETRSWIYATLIKNVYSKAIPHLRAIDFDIDNCEYIIEYLQTNQIESVVVIKGDPPTDMSKKVFPTTSVKLIKKLKKEIGHLKVYAAIDQYRSGIKEEFDYIEMKKDAGADGFLTQPFFDLRLIDIFTEKLNGTEVYIGISPVVTEKSQSYWESRNRAYFTKDFKPTLDWNVQFAKDVISYCSKNELNTYLMPIRINLESYLTKIFT